MSQTVAELRVEYIRHSDVASLIGSWIKMELGYFSFAASATELKQAVSVMRRQQPMAVRLDLEIFPGGQFPFSGQWTTWLHCPSDRRPGFDLPRRQWALLNRFRTVQDRRGACRDWRRISPTPLLRVVVDLLYNMSKFTQQIHNNLTLSHLFTICHWISR